MKIKSMTGFGRCELAEENIKFTVELKSVNHRYLEAGLKMPKALNPYESAIRAELKKYIERGKVDVFISYDVFGDGMAPLSYNKDLAAEYVKYYRQIAEDFGLENDLTVAKLARCPEVLTMDELHLDEEKTWHILQKALDSALEEFVKAREIEGENLQKDLVAKLDHMLELVDFVADRAPQIISDYKEKMLTKIKELSEDVKVDESRVLTEVTIFADKVCIDEEIVRLRSHIDGARKTLLAGGSCGRKLDFIAQEMNRESNTILSKTTDLETSNKAIELKNDIEKVREQIQNIE